MPPEAQTRCLAFAGSRRIAAGTREEVALALKAALEEDEALSPLVLDEATSALVELDLRGTEAEVLRRLADASASTERPQDAPRGRGRPRLGVVAREVTLLPRHWDWLNAQQGGASVALRKLVDAARRSAEGPDRKRRAVEAAYRFMTALAGDERGYEEATRALFAGNRLRFEGQIEAWPPDIRAHLAKLSEAAFEDA